MKLDGWNTVKSVLHGILGSLISSLPAEVQAQPETASVVANCRSVALRSSTGFISGVGTVTNFFTTYDGSTGIPMHDLVNGSWLFGEELRPRAGQPGVYETDFITYSTSGYIEYGALTINLPTTDSDGNGVPDILQLNKGVNNAVSGAGTIDWSITGFTGAFSVSGSWSRSANSQNGAYSITVSNSNGSVLYDGVWGVLYVSGSITYNRGTTNTLNFNLTSFSPDGSSVGLTGSTTFSVNSTNQVAIPQFYLAGTDGKTYTVHASVLNRLANRYSGNISLSDGNSATSWPDYTNWVLELTDTNDSNGNGIPDLSDALPIPPASCIPAPGGLVAWWPGDGNADDIVGNRNWVVFGGTMFVPGKVGQAFSFNGTDAYVARGPDVATTAVDNWAMATWVYWKGLVGTPGKQAQVLLYNGNGGANGYGILIPEQGTCPSILCPEVGKLVVMYGGISYIATGVALDLNAWNHVALVRENGVLKLYKNATLVFSNATVNPNPPSASNGYIYVGGGSENNFYGLLDEVMFFNAALTSDQAGALFAVDTFGVCKPLSFGGVTISTNSTVVLNVSGQAGKNITIYASSNLVNWIPIITAPNPQGYLRVNDPAAATFRWRFYKAAAQ